MVCASPLGGRQRLYCAVDCRKLAARAAWLEKVYGLTLDDYSAILAYQGGACGICRRPPKRGKSLAVDHSHDDGQRGAVRGLLCFFCNRRVLGARNAEVLIATAKYVQNPPAIEALGRTVLAPGRPRKARRPRKRPR